LFAILGVVFGSGDGSTTFTLPDYRDRMPIGAGTTYSAAGTGGSKDAVVVSHTHTITDPTHSHTQGGTSLNIASGNYAASSLNEVPYGTTSTNAASTGITIETAGVSGTNANLPPYLGIFFIIKT
jgi:microcystin-dependent protein